MPKFTRHTFWTIAFVSAAASSRGEVIQFQRDIRPILSDSCFQCHGADEANRQAELEGIFGVVPVVEEHNVYFFEIRNVEDETCD